MRRTATHAQTAAGTQVALVFPLGDSETLQRLRELCVRPRPPSRCQRDRGGGPPAPAVPVLAGWTTEEMDRTERLRERFGYSLDNRTRGKTGQQSAGERQAGCGWVGDPMRALVRVVRGESGLP